MDKILAVSISYPDNRRTGILCCNVTVFSCFPLRIFWQ